MTLVKASSLWLTNPVLPRVFSWVSWPLVVFLCPAGARRLPERWLLGAAGLLHCCFCPAGGEVQAPCLWLFRHGTGRIYTQTQRFLFSTSGQRWGGCRVSACGAHGFQVTAAAPAKALLALCPSCAGELLSSGSGPCSCSWGELQLFGFAGPHLVFHNNSFWLVQPPVLLRKICI